MLILKVLSLLLSYPETETLSALDEMAAVIEQDERLPKELKDGLSALIEAYRCEDLLDLQEGYVALFDRGRYLSLHLFEHVHGESRDRGQAMVNLLQLYESHGFEMNAPELPDYIPLFLEFLSQQEPSEAIGLLKDAMPVLSLLGARLHERGSEYRAVFAALENIAGEPEEISEIRRQASAETPDETLLNMDEIWEEEAVSFMGAGDRCQSKTADHSPVAIMPREQFVNLKQTSAPKDVNTAFSMNKAPNHSL